MGPLLSHPFLLLFSLSQQLDITEGRWVLRWRIWVYSPDGVVGHHIIPLDFSPLCLRGSACSGHFPAVESQPVCPSVSATLPEHRFSGSVHVESQGVPPSRGRVLSDCLAICHLADPSLEGLKLKLQYFGHLM